MCYPLPFPFLKETTEVNARKWHPDRWPHNERPYMRKRCFPAINQKIKQVKWVCCRRKGKRWLPLLDDFPAFGDLAEYHWRQQSLCGLFTATGPLLITFRVTLWDATKFVTFLGENLLQLKLFIFFFRIWKGLCCRQVLFSLPNRKERFLSPCLAYFPL